ncbi:MAG TPA: hypothetical protein VK907_03360 [Phnomibacter sp.]|nr:hypothetical protein [Phnomibacter sp.]
MRYAVLFALIVLSLLRQALSQDKVILISGDTIPVLVSGDPVKEGGISRRSMGFPNDYGFARVVIIYPDDSIRVQLPGQIRGYYKKDGGRYLGSGYYESREVDEKQLGYNRGQVKKVFFQRVAHHRDLTIWYYREHVGEAIPERYFFFEKKDVEAPDMIYSYRDWLRWAAANPPFDTIRQKIPPTSKGKRREYSLFKYFQDVMKRYKEMKP